MVGQVQDSLCLYMAPEAINSETFDGLIRAKRAAEDLITDLLVKRPGSGDLAKESEFFDQEWRERNDVMARNILRIAQQHPGQRIVVTTGAEHRCELRDRLAGKPGIVLKEFWEVTPGK